MGSVDSRNEHEMGSVDSGLVGMSMRWAVLILGMSMRWAVLIQGLSE